MTGFTKQSSILSGRFVKMDRARYGTIPGVTDCKADKDAKTATVTAEKEIDPALLKKAVEDAGYEVKD